MSLLLLVFVSLLLWPVLSLERVTVRNDRWMLANMLANNFEAMYPRFNRNKFIEACRP